MDRAPSHIVALGKVLKEWGLRGELKCQAFNPESDLFKKLKKIYWEGQSGWEPVEILQAKRHGNAWLVQFSGYSDPETSRVLRGKRLGLPREELPRLKKGEIYVADLPGLEVQNSQGEVLGQVLATQKIGDSEVLRIQLISGKEAMVPLLGDFIADLNMDERKLQLNEAAEELLEL